MPPFQHPGLAKVMTKKGHGTPPEPLRSPSSPQSRGRDLLGIGKRTAATCFPGPSAPAGACWGQRLGTGGPGPRA